MTANTEERAIKMIRGAAAQLTTAASLWLETHPRDSIDKVRDIFTYEFETAWKEEVQAFQREQERAAEEL